MLADCLVVILFFFIVIIGFIISVYILLLLCGISPHFVSTGDMADFICIREPSFCHVVSIRKREDPGN